MRPRNIPMKEILFAAKTGFISKSLWLQFFTQRSRSRNYRIWKSFEIEGYFKPHDSPILKNVLILAPKSIRLLRNHGVVAVTSPHINQFSHDENAARIALSLEDNLLIKSYLTEAELKKGSLYFWNQTDQSKGNKYPDLLINFPEGSKYSCVALEVEQSIKSFERYKIAFENYARQNKFDFILFASDHKAIFKRLSRAMEATHFPTWDIPVGYTDLSKFMENPRTAAIYLHNKTITLDEWLPKIEGSISATSGKNDVSHSKEEMDLRKL